MCAGTAGESQQAAPGGPGHRRRGGLGAASEAGEAGPGGDGSRQQGLLLLHGYGFLGSSVCNIERDCMRESFSRFFNGGNLS